MRAVDYGREGIVALLIDAKADIYLKDKVSRARAGTLPQELKHCIHFARTYTSTHRYREAICCLKRLIVNSHTTPYFPPLTQNNKSALDYANTEMRAKMDMVWLM